MHGYQLIQELTERSGGAWRPSPGAIYPTLHRLEDKGLVRSDDSDERRVFSLTDAGRTTADRLAAEGVAPWQSPSGSSRQARQEARDLKDQVGQLMGAVGQVFRAGTPAQRQKVQELLAETRRGIYRIMAEDEPAPAPAAGAAPAPDRAPEPPTQDA
jgi:DNA-binding PadR family transcriptional regulator